MCGAYKTAQGEILFNCTLERDVEHDEPHSFPVNGYCRDEKQRRLRFCVPPQLILDAPAQPSASSIEKLPTEILEMIAIESHPVDRICLALTSRSLLFAIFSRAISAPGQRVWSQFYAPGPRKSLPDDRLDLCTSDPSPNKYRFMFAFNCTHADPFLWEGQPFRSPQERYRAACSRLGRPTKRRVGVLRRMQEIKEYQALVLEDLVGSRADSSEGRLQKSFKAQVR